MTNEEFIDRVWTFQDEKVMEHAKKLIAIVEAIKNERKVHDDCYCDCNSGSCPCLPCSARIAITDLALENLERK